MTAGRIAGSITSTLTADVKLYDRLPHRSRRLNEMLGRGTSQTRDGSRRAPRCFGVAAFAATVTLLFAACSSSATPTDTPAAPQTEAQAASSPNAVSNGESSVEFDESKLVATGGTRFVALDDPQVLQASQAGYLSQDALIMGVSQNGDSRAYPVAMARYHHVINDTLGGDPVTVTY